ncbi:pitrilysin family protein [Pleionea sp. CnH1-48]|uniref:M16 family metallopeptidase n=1 Tax=Pleionea sp. CnH1-48 TaxID=2954494 RepID=UPI002096DF2C|nr:pitrilysin family protein [Pleionea sp. CnH1-48]MCO7225710.1 insulinase family protein [Pleionea sp. CnH1-48]
MKHWQILGVGASLILAACQSPNVATQKSEKRALPEGIQFIERVSQVEGEIVIPYEKYRMDNGLTIVIHEDHSDPLAHIDVTYHVGSAREELGKSGFAHFFEHMMFQGSEHVADEEHFKIVSESGGTLNGTTNSDRTNYYQTVPANQLEKMLWLEADRMGFLLDAVTQKKFEVQRETVKNERGQRVDNRPYGRLFERVSEAMYPVGHPYSWPVIGYMEDLNRVDVNDLKRFFLRWYGPNNAVLTVGGDVDTLQVLTLAKKYFGSIPRGPEVVDIEPTPIKLNADRYISMEDNVHLPLVLMSYPTVYARHEDEAALDLLGEIIGRGRTSLLYKNLVKSSIAVQSSVSHGCQELACNFVMYALPHPASGKTLADIEATIRASLKEFEQRGVTDDDLAKAKATFEANTILGLQSVAGKVSQLAAYETFTGNPNYIQKDIERYNSVTREDVMRVYEQYLKGKHAVIMSIVPKGALATIAHKDTFTPATREFEYQPVKESELKKRVAVDNFDRSKQPEAGANPLVKLPEFWKSTTANGIEVLGAKNDETPTTSLYVSVKGGHYNETIDKAGVAELMASLMNESTRSRSSEAMSLELQKLGSSISFSADDDSVNIYVNSLTKNLDKTLALLEEKITQPAFTEADFNRLKKQVEQGIENQKKDPSALASNAWLSVLYGNTIAGIPTSGTLKSVGGLSVADVKGFYSKFFKPAGAKMVVVTDLPEDKMNKALAVLNSWKGKSEATDVTFAKRSFDPKTIYMVNKDEAAQSVIRIGKRNIPRDFTGEFFKSGLMNFVLGGAFNSRINLNLREDKGYTYGARSYFWGDKLDGGYTATSSVRADVTDKAFVEIMNEIKNYHDKGIADEELDFMRRAIGQRDALKYETPSKKLGFLSNILDFELGQGFVDEQSGIIKNISKDEINQLAKKHLDVNSMVKLVVGDAKTLKPQFEALGYKVEMLSND